MTDVTRDQIDASAKTEMSCCGNCVFWLRTRKNATPGHAGGICRAEPPIPMQVMQQVPPSAADVMRGQTAPQMAMSMQSFFPMTIDSEWCGAHLLDEDVTPANGADLAGPKS